MSSPSEAPAEVLEAFGGAEEPSQDAVAAAPGGDAAPGTADAPGEEAHAPEPPAAPAPNGDGAKRSEVEAIVEKFRAMGGSAPSPASPTSPTAGKATAAVSAGTVTLQLNYAPGVALIRFNNVSKRNAISAPMIAQFHDAVSALETVLSAPPGPRPNPLVAVVLAGAARTFCAGFDLDLAAMIGVAGEGTTEEEVKGGGYEMSVAMGEALLRLRRLDLMSVAAVDGFAIGGGAEIAAACDFRVLTDNAFVRFVQVKIGLTTAWGGATFLRRLVGTKTAMRWLTSTKRLEHDEMERTGFADRLVMSGAGDSDDHIVREALAFLAPAVYLDHQVPKPSPHPPEAVRAMKRAARGASADADEAREVEAEREAFVALWGGRAMREAVSARRKHG
ncbi:ClpP/crotonase-like domain-containing protein [Hyaloraphidium curvatum]|nr:ClpP/crotonase-like domain-containing protein [Hyaloraphidium curvatum]